MDLARRAERAARRRRTNWAVASDIDDVNATGNYAANQRIGIAEDAQHGIYDLHDAFGNASVSYAQPVPSCDPQAPACVNACGMVAPVCLNNHCACKHESEVASAAMWGDYGASHAELHVYNGGTGIKLGCSPSDQDDAYTYFATHDVSTIIQSWGCPGGGPDVDGVVQDYYVSKVGLTVTKSAGNSEHDIACPNTLNSICVGGNEDALTDFQFDGVSYKNPVDVTTSAQLDREEPDVTGLSHTVDVLGFANTSDHGTQSGTSFSTPAIAATIALMKDACEGRYDFEAQAIRVLLALSAYDRNPDGWRYSTSSLQNAYDFVDQKDGAGFPSAALAIRLCDADVVSTGELDLTDGTISPSGEGYKAGDDPPGEEVKSYTDAEDGARRDEALFDFGGASLPVGTRVRAVLAWPACARSDRENATDTAVRLPDLDRFLYNEDTQTYVYGSQTYDDNIEGFDIVIPTAGHHTIYVSWFDGATGCDGANTVSYAFGKLP